jgi:hypothetical protein
MTIISSLNHGAADLLAAIVEQARIDYEAGKEYVERGIDSVDAAYRVLGRAPNQTERTAISAYVSAVEFFDAHPHIPIIPSGYQSEVDIASTTGWTVEQIRQVCQRYAIRYREYAGMRYYMPAEIHRAAARKASAERGQG